jgi:hypothetical protein
MSVIPCVESIDWIIYHANTNNSIVINEEGRCVDYYLSSKLEKYYKITQPKVFLEKIFMEQFHEQHDINKVLSSW